ncbi:MAG TPA: hypothetical protein VGR42_12535 [Casimicrobiaceae bacterium]|nr:hypothetical protein [Casimicrobiaceae bacterium]
MTGPERTIVVRPRTRIAHVAGIAVGGDAPIAPHLKAEKQPINVKASA